MTGRIYPENIGQQPVDSRELLALEKRQLDAHSDIRERVAVLEAETKHFATKTDIANAKLWAVTSVLGAVVSVVSILLMVALTLFRLVRP